MIVQDVLVHPALQAVCRRLDSYNTLFHFRNCQVFQAHFLIFEKHNSALRNHNPTCGLFSNEVPSENPGAGVNSPQEGDHTLVKAMFNFKVWVLSCEPITIIFSFEAQAKYSLCHGCQHKVTTAGLSRRFVAFHLPDIVNRCFDLSVQGSVVRFFVSQPIKDKAQIAYHANLFCHSWSCWSQQHDWTDMTCQPFIERKLCMGSSSLLAKLLDG